ncbi:PREDICTED: uncharacterized protein LOC105954892 [Erythranthe guttata]|uniref:uncharacterized protein LOC105954892 n=1 Tax=Erythranthe guttata TaxID=4155 RepID=UPI00064DAAAD|nr:PREDICTED: uncharacterized protein LOC105954892 [Erythranthe guttata]|eukprot:XP_012834030.1 PREDICTED: uncharacterized protein LOC105954892 [Erythranthe guttata]
MRYGDIEVSNTFHSSRFMINANIDEINDYKSRLSEPDSCRVVSQMSSNSSYSYEDDFVHKSVRKTLDDLNESPEIGTCIVLATITNLVKKSKWWFYSCPNTKCKRSVEKDLKMWYKIEFIVMDDTNTATLIVFGKDAEMMLNLSIDALIQRIHDRGEDDLEYPNELDDLVDRMMLFKLNVVEKNVHDPANSTYRIKKVCFDDSVITAFTEHYQLNENHNNGGHSPSVNDYNGGPIISSKDSSSLSENNDCEVLYVTPSSKRPGDSVLEKVDDDPTLQHSTSKLIKKIKLEKME